MDDNRTDPEVLTPDETGSHSELVRADHAFPAQLYIIPIPNRPYFPGQVQPLVVEQEQFGETIKRASRTSHQSLGLCFVESEPGRLPNSDEIARVGTLVTLHRVAIVDDHIQFIARGVRRFRITGWVSTQQPYLAEVQYPFEPEEDANEIKAYGMAVIDVIKELIPLNPLYGEELKQYLSNFSPNEPSLLCDFAAALTTAKSRQLQEVLEIFPILERMKRVLPMLHKELNAVKLQSEINEEVNRKVSGRQREFFLREQLKTIQEELGISKDDKTAEAEEFNARLKGKTLSEAVQKRVQSEMKKMQVLEPGSPEYGLTRNYLDWVTAMPWGVYSEDKLNLKHARKVLDDDHDGLEDVKDRIIEFLAVGAYKQEVAGSIMLLVGPPGVGKTSIGKSVAEALGRKFYRFSLGGMRDEAEIKGHRRTYIGAMPGKLAQALKEVEVSNPVIMLDEIDKIGASYQGDPASALLEVLDPEQNSEFLDHYLDLRVDLSKVLFICTANQLDTIPRPLLDRMETIRLAGYLAEEKMAIAKNHLWPKAIHKAGLKKSQVTLHAAALRQIIESYAREAGVRQLEKMLQRIIRKAVVTILQDNVSKVTVSRDDLESYLGPPTFKLEKTLRGVGVVTGLAWTAMGGATLPVEATRIHDLSRGFKQTGQLGDVMRESSEIAYSYVASHCAELGIADDYFNKSFIHLHVPEGATPKDGPSAGITMATALVSMARNKPVGRPLAMSGELTLTGQVLAVGGIREKLIAAKRVKIREIILPAACEGDFRQLPDHVTKGLKVHFADTFADVKRFVFGS